MTVVREHKSQWIRPEIDLNELAKLRFGEDWSMDQLRKHFGCGYDSLYQKLNEIEPSTIALHTKGALPKTIP